MLQFDPLDEYPIHQGAAGRLIFWGSSTGRNYAIDYNTNLLDGSWVGLFTNVAGNGGTMSITDAPPDPKRSYRIGVKLP